MSKERYISTSPAIATTPGETLAALFGCNPNLLVDGGFSTPTDNAGNVTVVSPAIFTRGANTVMGPEQTTTDKVFRMGSVTVFSANGSE
jgi:hypothetical protein